MGCSLSAVCSVSLGRQNQTRTDEGAMLSMSLALIILAPLGVLMEVIFS
jgi:ABC-type antimicrobial peptide transport system permease subunit